LSLIAIATGSALVLVSARVWWLFLAISWFTTWGHEVSHALAGVLTGAIVHNLIIFPNGNGATDTNGGAQALITWAGYPGGMLWAAVLWRLGDRARHWLIFVVCGAIALTAMFWAQDPMTSYVLLVILALVGAPRLLPWSTPAAVWMKVLGATAFAFNWWRLMGLLALDIPSDASILESLTNVNAGVWVGSWCVMYILITIWVVQGEARLWAGKKVWRGLDRRHQPAQRPQSPLS
jgi:Peptidase M50B-like